MTAEEKLAELIKNSPRGTATKLADYIGLHKIAISKWTKHKGRYKIKKEHLPKIAEFFQVPIEYFLHDDIKQVKMIPKIGKASCGVPIEYNYEDAIEYVPYTITNYTHNFYVIDAEGDSMMPTIKNGDEVLCDLDASISNNDIVHFTFRDESGIKRYKEDENAIYLLADNPAYQPIVILKSEIGIDETLYTAKCIKVTSRLV